MNTRTFINVTPTPETSSRKLGDIYYRHAFGTDRVYVLSSAEPDTFALVNITTGLRYDNPVKSLADVDLSAVTKVSKLTINIEL